MIPSKVGNRKKTKINIEKNQAKSTVDTSLLKTYIVDSLQSYL